MCVAVGWEASQGCLCWYGHPVPCTHPVPVLLWVDQDVLPVLVGLSFAVPLRVAVVAEEQKVTNKNRTGSKTSGTRSKWSLKMLDFCAPGNRVFIQDGDPEILKVISTARATKATVAAATAATAKQKQQQQHQQQ